MDNENKIIRIKSNIKDTWAMRKCLHTSQKVKFGYIMPTFTRPAAVWCTLLR